MAKVHSGGCGDLLKAPTKADIHSAPDQVERMDVDCELDIDRFVTQKSHMAAQYSDIYFVRLSLLKPKVLAEAKRLWPTAKTCDRILEVEVNTRCVLVGTIYKEMKLKPNILAEFTDGGVVACTGLDTANLVSDTDYAVIEDESGRITLKMEGEIIPSVSELVTGVIIGMVGSLDDEGIFTVEDVCYAGIPPQEDTQSDFQGDAQVLLVSGLGLGGSEVDALAVDMLVDFVTGSLGSGADHEEAARIVKVIVAGNSCAMNNEDKAAERRANKSNDSEIASHPIRELDMLLTRLCASVHVDLMPGAADPSGVFLPQQPFHNCLLPSANSYSTFHMVTNPYGMKAGGASASHLVFGTSGQNVTDVLRYSSIPSSVDVLELMLRWRHMAPTAPDTLPCFPIKDTDPFILDTCPRVFFVGNQPEFSHKLIEGPNGQRCLILSLPAFAKSGSAAVVNLRTLECNQVVFDVGSLAQGTS